MDFSVEDLLKTKDRLQEEKLIRSALSKIKQRREHELNPEEMSAIRNLTADQQDLATVSATNRALGNMLGGKTAAEKDSPEIFKEKVAKVTQDMILSSLMKDTPEGHYQNTMAKSTAENEVNKKNYTEAYQKLHGMASQSFEQMIQESPELGSPVNIDKAQKYFKVLLDYAPPMALNPTAASSFVKKVIQYGGIDEKTIHSLIQTNNEYMKHHTNLM